jgi:hypothetical protein
VLGAVLGRLLEGAGRLEHPPRRVRRDGHIVLVRGGRTGT